MNCKCDMRTKLVGDGCEHCNPEIAAMIAAGNAAWDRAIYRKANALRMLAPLGFEDAADGEMPGAIWHRDAAITLDCATMSLAHVVEALLSIGREQGRDEVRAMMRRALAL